MSIQNAVKLVIELARDTRTIASSYIQGSLYIVLAHKVIYDRVMIELEDVAV